MFVLLTYVAAHVDLLYSLLFCACHLEITAYCLQVVY